MVSQFAMHLIRHAVEVIIRAKNNRSRPVIIAPGMLVVTNVIPRRITEVRIVPRIPKSCNGSTAHRQRLGVTALRYGETASVRIRYTTAMPNSTHKNAGVTVITAVILRTVVITPIITAAITERATHPFVQLQLQL